MQLSLTELRMATPGQALVHMALQLPPSRPAVWLSCSLHGRWSRCRLPGRWPRRIVSPHISGATKGAPSRAAGPAVLKFHTQGSSRVHAGNSYVELQNTLAFPEIGLRSVNIPSAQPQTCGWLFESAEYKRWLDPKFRSRHHGILWLKGKPGAGKSTLMKAGLRHSRATPGPDRLILFFFSARGQELEKFTEGMYRALLHQVVLEVDTLLDLVEPVMMANFQKTGWPLELLKELFRETSLWFSDKGGLVCYIDALDECDEYAIRDMLSLFEELAEQATLADLRFLVCFASRHYPNINVEHREEIILKTCCPRPKYTCFQRPKFITCGDMCHLLAISTYDHRLVPTGHAVHSATH